MDRQFVFACATLGTIDAGIVAAFSHFIGKDAAGVASVALVALFTAILKQYETLRFKRAEADGVEIAVPKLRVPFLFLSVLAIFGLYIIFSLVLGLGWLTWDIRLKHQNILALSSDLTMLMESHRAIVVVNGLVGAVNFIAGYLITKSARIRSFTYAMLSSCIFCISMFFVVPVLLLFSIGNGFSINGGSALIKTALPSLGFVFLAMVGARLGFPGRKIVPTAPQIPVPAAANAS